MDLADSISRLGFGRWYERRLIEGHAWFASSFLCLVAVLACVEELNYRGTSLRLLAYFGMISAASALGIYALVRYQRILSEAMRLGELATCRSCGAYASFGMISSSRVRCRKCAHEWRLLDAI